LSLQEARDLPFIRRALVFANIIERTESEIGIAGMGNAVMAEIAPLSMHLSGARH